MELSIPNLLALSHTFFSLFPIVLLFPSNWISLPSKKSPSWKFYSYALKRWRTPWIGYRLFQKIPLFPFDNKSNTTRVGSRLTDSNHNIVGIQIKVDRHSWTLHLDDEIGWKTNLDEDKFFVLRFRRYRYWWSFVCFLGTFVFFSLCGHVSITCKTESDP